MDNYLQGIVQQIKQHKNRPQENIEKTIIKKIKNIIIVQEHIDNTEKIIFHYVRITTIIIY